jgi:RHS repeat-associated protein
MPNTGEMINYTYTASGAKIRQQLETDGRGGLSTRRDYAGPFVFVNNAPGWVGTPHGRFVYVNDGWQNEFHLRDHLGNTRRVVMEEDTGTLATLQQNHYYPFGMLIPSLSTSNTIGALKDNRYLYNGKEFNDDSELNWHDYGARFYDAQIGRWHSVDPLAEHPKQIPKSPYAAMWNNPIRYYDPDGRCPECFRDVEEPEEGHIYTSSGNETYVYGNGDWTRQGGDLPEVVVTTESAENQTSNNNQANNTVDDVAFGSGLFTTMVSEAARGINSPLIRTIGRTAGALGGVVGTIDNTVQAANAFSEGNYVKGTLQSVQAVGYVVGTGMLFSPLAPVGAVILGVNAAIDLGESFYKNW